MKGNDMRANFIFLLLLAAPAAADPLLYRMSDTDNTVWLLGSVHALRASDYPLDERIESAYTKAERVVLEVDPAELQPARLGALMTTFGRRENGQLSDAFTRGEFDKVREQLAALGLNAEQLQPFDPWFVGLQVFGLNLLRNGFTGADGVDRHFGNRALGDGKRTGGLETAAEQMTLFDALPDALQKTLLLDALKDSGNFRAEMERLVDTWRRGDVHALEQLIETEFSGAPELRDALLADRNRNWIDDIASYLEAPGDTLVIVGALHLVGDEGVVALLESRGYDVERVGSDANSEQ